MNATYSTRYVSRWRRPRQRITRRSSRLPPRQIAQQKRAGQLAQTEGGTSKAHKMASGSKRSRASNAFTCPVTPRLREKVKLGGRRGGALLKEHRARAPAAPRVPAGLWQRRVAGGGRGERGRAAVEHALMPHTCWAPCADLRRQARVGQVWVLCALARYKPPNRQVAGRCTPRGGGGGD